MDILVFAIYFAACFGAGVTGAIFPPGEWYQSLKKPHWTPPNWVFPTVWTTLYILMSWSAARVSGASDGGQAASIGLALWALQVALNALWTPVFFGLRRLRGGMMVLVPLWLSVAGTLVAFWTVDWISGLMFVPYLIWVTVAGALNFSVWRLNPDAAPLDLSR
ncbi:TspO/MBR family protein [Tropicimonas sp. IMCC34043]|uniref:tryptophan-rich sensory protein TspO n=1 Tax=Tropicimonas sp. IMCC34043 TaxID=2248760 RepID=UPI000E23CA00|nr:TspO/MBR family protein [Tropicimonas sp. IMCC34043]